MLKVVPLPQPESRGKDSATGVVRKQLQEFGRYAEAAAELFGSHPWKLNVTDSSIEVFAALEPRLRKIDLDGREALITAGSAVFMLRLALKCHQLLAEVEYTPSSRQPGLLARLRVVGRVIPSAEEIELFSALTGEKAPSGEIAPGFHPLKKAASEEGITLRYVEGGLLRNMASDMLQAGDRLFYQRNSDRDVFREWLGVVGDCANSGTDLVTWHVTPDEIDQARRPIQPLTAGDFAVLCTRRDDETNWLKTGMALGHLQLAALASGILVTVFNQPLQVFGMRARFARETGFCSFPQVILRVLNVSDAASGGCGCPDLV